MIASSYRNGAEEQVHELRAGTEKARRLEDDRDRMHRQRSVRPSTT